MTTFGQARLFEELGPIARKYGIPVGGMNWPEDIRPIMTYPAAFGWEKKSFIFGIPTVVPSLLPASTLRAVRLVPGELQRLRNISSQQLKTIRRDQQLVRDSLKNRRSYEFGAGVNSTDVTQDDFLRSNDVDNDLDDLNPYFWSGRPIPHPRKRFRIRSVKRPLPVRHDITWILRFASDDVLNFSTYLNQRGIHRKGPLWMSTFKAQHEESSSLPSPYYAPSLRVNIATSPRYPLIAKATSSRLRPPQGSSVSANPMQPSPTIIPSSTSNPATALHTLHRTSPFRRTPHRVANLLKRSLTTLIRWTGR